MKKSIMGGRVPDRGVIGNRYVEEEVEIKVKRVSQVPMSSRVCLLHHHHKKRHQKAVTVKVIITIAVSTKVKVVKVVKAKTAEHAIYLKSVVINISGEIKPNFNNLWVYLS